jgi:hypothetical protein
VPGQAHTAGAPSKHIFVFRAFNGPLFFPLLDRDPTPSFALMDIQGPVVVTYVYQLIESEVRVEKVEFRKEVDPAVVKDGPRSIVMPQNIPSSPGSKHAHGSVW